jgi:hypothetical protein
MMSNTIRSHAELREFIRASLRIQHPEWVAPDGASPLCDFYEARFAELLGLTHGGGELGCVECFGNHPMTPASLKLKWSFRPGAGAPAEEPWRGIGFVDISVAPKLRCAFERHRGSCIG